MSGSSRGNRPPSPRPFTRRAPAPTGGQPTSRCAKEAEEIGGH